MAKARASWSKPDRMSGLIGRKQVDWSIFESGTTIPKEFHEDFQVANHGTWLASDERRDVTLVLDGQPYSASLISNERKDGANDRVQLRYDSAKEFKELLRNRLKVSYDYLKAEREAQSEGGTKKVFIRTAPAQADFLDFYETGTAFTYRVEIVTGERSVPDFEQVWPDLEAIIGQGLTITTLGHKAENQLRWKGEAGIEVTANKADVLPPSMFQQAWDALAKDGLIRPDDFPGTARYRSAAISAILALLPYVEYTTHPKLTLFLTGRPFQQEELRRLFDAPAPGYVIWSGNSDQPKVAAVVVDEALPVDEEGHGEWEEEAVQLTASGPGTKVGEVLKRNRDNAFPLYLFRRSAEDSYSYVGRYQVDRVAESGPAYTYRLKPAGEQRAPRSWVFQGNPKTFDTTGALAALPEFHWLVNRYKEQIQPGDRVFLWEAGPNAGVVAVATVLTEPALFPRPEELKPFWRDPSESDEPKLRVFLHIDIVLNPRILRQRLVDSAVLKDAHIIKIPTGTNFALTPEQAEALTAMIDEPVQVVEPILDLSAVVSQFEQALTASHIHFGEQNHDKLVRAFISALATKRLAILTGLSGSGKTQIAIRFGQWLGDQRSMLIPVRPDWTGAEALFGYEDALQKRSDDGRPAWHVPDALAFMLKAARDQHNPYLLILDEMNLAHVERYFADVLSGMESDQACLPNLEQEGGTWRPVAGGPATIRFPRNLFIVGTVNVDETTYMFSPKVLDRANTFEFRVEPGDLRTDLQKPVDCAPGDLAYVRGFLAVARDDQWQVDNQLEGIEQYTAHLKTLHALLYEGGFEFGHRVFYEAVRFAAMMQSAGNHDLDHTLDLQLMQKVLPRLHGTRRRLEAVLCALGQFCYELTFAAGSVEGGKATQFNLQAKPEKTPRLPRSFDKVKRMYRNLLINQFTSFTE